VDHGARHVDAHPDDGERHDGESHAGSPLGDGASRNDPARPSPGPVRADGPASTADSVTALRRRISRPLPGGRTRDPRAAQRAVADLLVALGRDPSSEHLADTPRRVADALLEMTTPPDFDLTTFPNDEGYDEMVVAVGIPLHSLCEHHLLPFHGVAHIGYLPGDRILGISKLARVAELFARDLQVQERLTAQIADWLTENLNPRGVGVVISAEHLCQSLRGVRAPGVQTVTSALRGMLRTDGRTRDEFLSLTRR
jgi:GTP cyclohydrolase I